MADSDETLPAADAEPEVADSTDTRVPFLLFKSFFFNAHFRVPIRPGSILAHLTIIYDFFNKKIYIYIY